MARMLVLLVILGCGAPQRGGAAGALAPISRAADAAMLQVPDGPYIAGSTAEEREQAYRDAQARARPGRWFEREEQRHDATLPAFRLDRTHVTAAAYAEFVADTGRAAPSIDEGAWRKQGFIQDYATQVARYNWIGGQPPEGRGDHPVLLVTHAEAAAYCAWRGRLVGEPRRLPTAAEMEKASRGPSGLVYPWGEAWDPARVVRGDTEPVGSREVGPYGHRDLAGQAFHWTATPWPFRRGDFTVTGSAWDDGGGVGRGAARHGRPAWVRHAIVGFRCAGSDR